MIVDKNLAKLMAVEIMGEDYRGERGKKESKLIRFFRRVKKCLRGC